MNYTYLLLTIAIFLLSLFLQHRILKPLKEWKFALATALIISILFSTFSSLLENAHAVDYNKYLITGFFIGSLPFEERLFCVVMPFASLSIYSYLNIRFPGNNLDRFSLTVSNLLIGFCVAMIFFGYRMGNIYNICVYVALGLLLIFIEYINKLRFMYRFYRSWIAGVILFCPVYFAVTGLSHLPAYFMFLMLLATYLLELFKSKSGIKKEEIQ